MYSTEPKYKEGDICYFLTPGFENSPEEYHETMIINGQPNWYPYSNHPNGGYWQYPIQGKANNCPEDLLRLKTV